MRPATQKILIAMLLIPACIAAQPAEDGRESLVIKQTSDFDITGAGDSEEWNATAWIPLVRRKGTSDYITRAKLLYSDTGIYGLFACQDVKISSTLKEDFARLWEEDVVEIFLWTDPAVPIYFEYELSPTNYELPLLVPNLEGNFLGWRPWQYEGDRKIRHATKIVEDKNGTVLEWRAEFFIPYALLQPLNNVPPEKGTEWRMNMYRNDIDGEYASWSWRPVLTNYHDYERFGRIRFE